MTPGETRSLQREAARKTLTALCFGADAWIESQVDRLFPTEPEPRVRQGPSGRWYATKRHNKGLSTEWVELVGYDSLSTAKEHGVGFTNGKVWAGLAPGDEATVAALLVEPHLWAEEAKCGYDRVGGQYDDRTDWAKAHPAALISRVQARLTPKDGDR